MTGIVDWVNACVGPAEVDAAHCASTSLALRTAYADRVVPGDPAWDIEAAFGFLDWGGAGPRRHLGGTLPEIDAVTARARLEAFVAEALARLG